MEVPCAANEIGMVMIAAQSADEIRNTAFASGEQQGNTIARPE
jgi:hypothetical protein